MSDRKRAWLAALVFLPALAGPAAAQQMDKADINHLPMPRGTAEESETCLGCHDSDTYEAEMENKEVKKLFVDKEVLSASIHAKLECTDCHRDLQGKGDGHDPGTYASARRFAITFSEQCKHCHFANYTKTLDSVHHAMQARGDEKAAICTDCHGAHDTSKAKEPRSKISHTCAACHQKISDAYAASVHGAALAKEENPDVPTCTDCHRAHDIKNPRKAAWRLRVPETCGNCHAKEKIGKKYKLSTKVLSTYLDDFHGTTAALELAAKGEQPYVALCTDCHGVHDIAKTDDAKSRVMQDNLTKTCQSCHPEATKSFSAAWLSHYEPSLTKHPLVYLVKAFYAVLIPFMIAGLLLQIVLHLWRVVVNR